VGIRNSCEQVTQCGDAGLFRGRTGDRHTVKLIEKQNEECFRGDGEEVKAESL
jgi:hypothetical protein